MSKYDFPLRKTFEQDFVRPGGKKLFTIQYEQATMEEYSNFFAMTEEEREEHVLNIVRSKIPLTFFERVIKYFRPNYITRIEREVDMKLVARNVLENKFRLHKSVYDALPKEESKASYSSLPSANMAIVCQRYNIDPFTLRKTATIEQYLWLLDGVIFLNNEMDDEGRGKNRYVMVDRDAVKKRAEQTKKSFKNKK